MNARRRCTPDSALLSNESIGNNAIFFSDALFALLSKQVRKKKETFARRGATIWEIFSGKHTITSLIHPGSEGRTRDTLNK